MESSLDFLSSILDEIALEGLDGITLSSLWLRLQNRQYFPIAIDEDSKHFLWECIAVHTEVELYQLPETRPPLVLFNRYEFLDTDLGIVIDPPETPSDIYPMYVIDENGVKGSCATYHSRKCISSKVRQGHNLLVSLQIAIDRWGDKLVLVASQEARNASLMGSEINPMIEISTDTYCLLERIGRSRFNGEVTQGEAGLLSLNTPFRKNLHYHRLILTNKGLITKQLHYMKSKTGQTISGSLFHLSRFYVERQSRMQIMTKCMIELLKTKPNCQEEMKTLRSELGMKEASYKKLFSKPLNDCIKVSVVPFREMYPQASEKEYLTSNGQERIIKIAKLIGPYQEIEETESGKNESSLPPNIYFDPQKVVFNRPLLQQVYKIVESSGYEGISAQEIGRKITLPKLEVRQLCNSLFRKNVVEEMVQERGRQKVKIYICKQFVNKNLSYVMMEEQRKKILEMPVCPLIEKDSNNREDFVTSNCEADDNQVINYVQKNKDLAITNAKTGNIKISGSFTTNSQNISEVSGSKNEKYSRTELESSSSFTENLKAMHDTKLKNPALISNRSVKRAHIIIKAVTNSKVMLISELQKHITEEEKKESPFTLDKKSLLRLLVKLAKDGLVKQGSATLQLEPLKQLHYVCHPSISNDDPLLKSIIEQAKFKYFSVSKDSNAKQGDTSTELKTANPSENCSSLKLPIEDEIKLARMECKPAIGKTYGLEPKFLRAKTLHTFLYYLLYNYEGTAENSNDLICIYHKSETWKRFVPPLPEYIGFGEGWCLLADVILSMPLSIFVKLVNTGYKIEGLDDYLDDSEKRHYLLRYLPQKLKNSLLYARRYIFSIHEISTRLCYMGLLSFGPQLHKEKDQIFIYVHQNASIKDTSISRAGYIYVSEDIQYNVKNYFFQTIDDIDSYWVDLETICLHTPLGSYNTARGKSFPIHNVHNKLPMIQAQMNKNVDDIVDKGDIPGDGLGAGGLDSSMYAHIKRNWSCPNICKKVASKKLKSKEKEKVQEDTYLQYLLKGSTKGQHPERKRRLQRLARSTSFITNHQTSQNLVELSKSERSNERASKRRKAEIDKAEVQIRKAKKSIVKIRTIKRKKMWKKRRPYYDDKDKAALNKMSKMRVDWTAQEDSFLLLCKVASTFLDPNCRRLVVPFTVVRDFLHERFPGISDNKTSRACQRRVRYMLLNPATSCNVAVFLGEAKEDMELVHEFDKPKPPKTQETEWMTMFRSVLNRLLTKFTLSPSDRCKKVSLPERLEEFYKSYEVKTTGLMFSRQCTHQDPHNYVDIRVGVVYALIISSLATIGDKMKWSFLLYKLYMQYPESLLRSVVARLRNEQLITKKKNCPKKKVQNEPLSNLPYRFSCTYENGLHTRFPSSVFEEAHCLFKKLNAKYPPEGVELDGDILPGYCAAVLSLTAMHRIKFEMQIPDQIVLFDSTLSAEECSKIVERMRELQSLTDEASDELESFLKEGNTKNMLVSESNIDSYRPVTKKRTLDGSLKEYSKTKSLHFDHPGNNIIENYSTCSVTQTAANTSAIDEANVSNSKIHIEQSHASKASRFALYMLRQEFTQPPTERVHHSQDYFVINSCRIVCTLKDLAENKHSSQFTLSLNENFDIHSKANKNVLTLGNVSMKKDLFLEQNKIAEIITAQSYCIPPTVISNSQHNVESIYCNHDAKTLKEGQAIFNHIHQKKDVGISHSELWEKFRSLYGTLSFQNHMSLLRKAMLVFRVGITCFRYVSVAYCKHWLLHSLIVPKEMKSYASECVKREQNMRKSESDLNMCLNECDKELEDTDSCNQLSTETNKNAGKKHVDAKDYDTKLEGPSEISDNQRIGNLNNLGEAKPLDHAGETSLNLVSSENDQHLTSIRTSSISSTECRNLQDNQEENMLGRTCRRKKRKGHSVELTSNRVENWESVVFPVRTWRKPDGSLNRPILMKLLKSVLSYLFTDPGATDSHICEHYSLVLQPIQTLELLEILEMAQCIKKYYTRCSDTPTLFSKLKSVYYTTNNPEPGDLVHYEPTVDAILKIGQLSDSIIIKH